MKNANEILESTGLDFSIEKAPLFALNSLGEQVSTPYFGLINSKTQQVINTVKEGYSVSQNKEVVELVVEGLSKFGDDLEVVKGGSINGGRKIYLQLAIEGDGLVGTDRIKRFITIIDSNDGSTGLSIGIGDLTMSCQNQFMKFYKASESKFRHTASMQARIIEIPFLIETALGESLKQVELYKRFERTDLTKDLAHQMVKHVLGYDREFTSMDVLSKKSTRAINIMDKLYASIDTEIAQKGFNLWGLHSGVTRFTTHEMASPNRLNGGVESQLFGNAYKANQKSLAFATNKSNSLVMA